MCEVNDRGGAGETSIQEDDALDKIFLECDVPSTGRVSVAKLVGYMRDHMSTQGSPEILKDLRTSMSAVSYNGEVTRKQYHDVSRRWLMKIRKRQHYLEENHQDGNNNHHIDRNSDSRGDSVNDDTVELAVNELPGTTTRIRTTLGLTVPLEDYRAASVGAADSRSESDARSLQGFLDLSTSTAVDDVGISCETPDPYFGDLSSVDGADHMAVDDSAVTETAQDLRLRAHRCARDNDHLREELQRAEDTIATLEGQLTASGRKLQSVNNRCERLRGEYEEHKELLAAAERDREALGAKNQRLERDNSVLKKEIHAADKEMLRLNADLDKVNEQKEELIRLLAQCQIELIERQTMYDEVKGQVLQMELTNDKLNEKHAISASTTEHLKIVVKELETRIAELQLNQNYVLHGGGLFASPTSDTGIDGDEARILQNSDRLILRSLHDEMIATGYNDPEVGRGDDVTIFNNTTEDESTTSCEYVDTMRFATEKLERATAEVAASHKELGIGLPRAESHSDPAQPLGQDRVNLTGNREHFASAEYLQRFKSQIQQVLTILSLVASRKVTNAETKDATTQLDCRDSVPELQAVCNDINKFSPSCRRENLSLNKAEEVSVTESNPRVPSARAASSFVPPLDVSLLTSRLTSTPCASPRDSFSPAPLSGYFCERAIIIPIVAALDEIIQGTNGSSGEADPTRSPIGSRQQHNPRYIYTLPSGGPSDLKGKMSRGAEPPLSPMPTDDHRSVLSMSPSEMTIDELESDGETESGGYVHPTYDWRRQESTTTDDTSDDTYGMGSDKSHSQFSGEPNCRSADLDSSTGSPDSSVFTEAGGLNHVRKIIPDHTPETCHVKHTSAFLENQTSPCDGNRGPDVVEDLNIVLERLTLRTGLSGDEHRGVHTNYHIQGTMINARGYSLETTQGMGHQPPGGLPKRKSSVYHGSFDFCGMLEMGQRSEGISDISTLPGGVTVPNECGTSSVFSSRKLDSVYYAGRQNEYGDLRSRKWDFTAETCESLAGMTPGTIGDTIESPGNGASQAMEIGPPHPPIVYDTDSATVDRYPCEDSDKLSSDLAAFTTTGIMTRGVLDMPSPWPSTSKPTKSEVSLGDRRTNYVISGNRSPPSPTTTTTQTRYLPSNCERPGDDASADSAEWRSDDRETPVRSRSVALAMSSEEDSSDSECTRDRIDPGEHAQVVLVPLPSALPTSPPLPPPQRRPPSVGSSPTFSFGDPLAGSSRDTSNERNTSKLDEDRQHRSKNRQPLGRSLSESDMAYVLCPESAERRSKCRCSFGWNGTRDGIPPTAGGTAAGVSEDATQDTMDQQSLRAFPNLTDTRLFELGLVDPLDGLNPCERIGEDELERKYTALSIGLETDRVTLSQRLTLSLRQRDQAERNLATEVERMQRDIQALAPLCVDRESVERVERVRHQLEMISRCTLRVSCTAELLGATHQERRVSRAALLADRYLQALRARCDKNLADLAETKRILTENNIVVEENPNELVDDIVPRLRYRGVPSGNRTTISRRRASIATISRPAIANTLQDAAMKDVSRQQRTSVSGRMTLRRPSLGYDTQRWDNEKLDRTDSSSSSIGELREVFEQAESRRGSREENNNLIRSQSSNFSIGSCESGDSDVWAIPREDLVSFQAETRDEELSPENTLCRRTPILRTIQQRVSQLPISWYILFVAVFFFGFYSNRYVTTRSAAPFKWWSIDEIMKRYVRVQRNVPPPI